MERGERSYTMTLPLGTTATIAVHTGLIPAANALYEENKATGYTIQDALTMLGLTTVSGEQVKEVNTATLLDPVEYITLRYIVENLMKPTQQQMDATVATLKLVEKPVVLEPVAMGDTATQGHNPEPVEYGAPPIPKTTQAGPPYYSADNGVVPNGATPPGADNPASNLYSYNGPATT